MKGYWHFWTIWRSKMKEVTCLNMVTGEDSEHIGYFQGLNRRFHKLAIFRDIWPWIKSDVFSFLAYFLLQTTAIP